MPKKERIYTLNKKDKELLEFAAKAVEFQFNPTINSNLGLVGCWLSDISQNTNTKKDK